MSVAFGLFDKNVVNNAKNLEKYGLAVKDAHGNLKPFDEILGITADKFLSLPTATDQAAFAMNVFGRSGKSMIPILKLGSKGIAEMEAKAKELGVVLNQSTVDTAIKLSIAEREFGEAMKGAAVSIGTAFLPVATKVVDWATQAVESFTALPSGIKTATLTFFVLTGAIAAVVKVGALLAKIWGPIVLGIVNAARAAIGWMVTMVALAVEEGVLATATYALDLALGVLSSSLLPIVAGLALLGVAVAIAVNGVHGLKDAIIEAVQPLDTVAKAFVLSKEQGVSFSSALATMQARADGTTISMKLLAQATASFDPTKLLGEAPARLQEVTGLTLGVDNALSQLGKTAGVSTDSVIQAFDALTLNSKTTLADVLGVIDQVKKAWSDWHDSIVSNLGGAGSALSQFADKANVSLSKAVGSLKSYTAKIKTFGTDISTIQDRFGSKANDFINWAQEQGLAQLGLVDSVAKGSDKLAGSFIRNWGKAQSATSTLATQIQHALDPVFKGILSDLDQLVAKITGVPPIRLDVKDNASAKLSAIQQHVIDLARTYHITVVTDSVSGQHGGAQEHGGFLPGAAQGGFVSRQQQITVGEHGKPEMILPLRDARGIEALTTALRMAGAGGSSRMHIISGQLDPISGQVRIVAREEVDDDKSYAKALGMMGAA